MDKTIDFYFDFISPFAYLASRQIEAIAARHGFALRWHAFRVGVTVVKVMGLKPVPETPLKGPYALKDGARMARVMGAPYNRASEPLDPVVPNSAFWAAHAVDPAQAVRFVHAAYDARFGRAERIDQRAVLKPLLAQSGLDGDAILADEAMQSGRRALTDATARAIEGGVFGAPTFAIGGELIWGVDRLWMLEHYLANGCIWLELPPEHSARGA